MIDALARCGMDMVRQMIGTLRRTGISTTIAAFAAFMASVTPLFAREMSSLVINDDTLVVTVGFTAGEPGDGHVLYYVWSNDGEDKGAALAAWPNVVRLGRVADDATSYSFALPATASVTARYAARAFLATSDRNYDNVVEYVASTGAQYVDTGIYGRQGTKSELDFASTEALSGTKNVGMLAARKNNSGDDRFYLAYFYKGFGFAYKTLDTQSSTITTIAANTRYMATTVIENGSQSLALTDGTTTQTQSKSTTGDYTTSPNALDLFANNSNGSHGNKSSIRLYACKIWQTSDGTGEYDLVRDYVPCLYNGTAGLYDAANNTFSASATATPLAASSVTNLTYAVDSGDIAVASSPAYVAVSSDFTTDAPYVESGSFTSATGGSKSGAAPLVLSGANDWGGTFTVNEGALIADFGQGLAATDNLVFNGGTYGLLSGSTFNWTIGSGGGQTSIGAGATEYGFTAYTHPFAVIVGGDASTPLEFGTASAMGFHPTRFILNDDWATDTVTFKNGISGNNSDSSTPTLQIYTGAADATVEGNMSGVNLTKTGEGTLALKGAANALGTIAPKGGTLIIAPPDGVQSCTLSMSAIRNLTSDGGSIVVSNAVVTQGGENMNWYGGTMVSFVGSTVTSSSEWYPGNREGAGKKSELVLDGATINATGSTFAPGYQTAASCDITITNAAALNIGLLEARNGAVRQYGGSVNVSVNKDEAISLGVGGGTFDYHLYGGSLVQSRSGSTPQVRIGHSSSGTGRVYVHQGATFTAKCSNTYVGYANKCTGGLYVRGGTATVTSALHVGRNGYGTCEVSDGGLLNIKDGLIRVSSGTNAERTGTLRVLTGGQAQTRAIVGPTNDAVTATLVIDGGKVVANASASADFINGLTAAYVGVGGGEIDTNGQDLEVSQSFAARTGTGQSAPSASTAAELAALPAFTKTGTGRLSLIGTNDWLCATCVSNGTLAVGERALPATTLRLGGGVIDLGGETHAVANLIGSGIVSNGTLVVTGTVWPGVGDSGILKIDATASLSLSTLGCAVAADGTCGCLEVDGTLDLSGVTVVGEGLEYKPEGKGLTLVRAGAITGSPATVSIADNGVGVRGGVLCIGAPGLIIFVR